MPVTKPGRRSARGPRTFRFAVLALTLLVTAFCNRQQLHARAAPAATIALPAAILPARGERVLVFAPHPDDEVLALGGLIYQSRQRGAHVRVVYLTSGDGFRLCAAAKYHRWPSQARMRRLAGVRESEARAALARLALLPGSATFLGYPDRGLAELWLDHWSDEAPYRSPHTGDASVSSRTAFRAGAQFSGESALRDVDRILELERPDWVYYPDPADDHPDHWAAHCLVHLALERRGLHSPGAPPLRRTYLVHRGEWPEPMRSEPAMQLLPPEELRGRGVRWERVSLSPTDIAAKSRALAAYASQQALAGDFLSAFIRSSELLSLWPDDPVARRLPAHVSTLLHAPRSQPLDPGPVATVMRDSTRDRFARSRVGAVDFTAVEVQATSGGLRLAAMLRRPAAAWATYDLYWKPVTGPARSLETRRYRLSSYRCEPGTTRFEIEGNRLQVTVPKAELSGSTRIMVSAAAWSGPALLDRTPWRPVTVSQ